MTFIDLFERTRWSDLYNFFASGSPPLIVDLLAINTIFFMLYVVRKATAKHRMRDSSVYVIQGLLIAANMMVVFQHETMLALNAMRRML